MPMRPLVLALLPLLAQEPPEARIKQLEKMLEAQAFELDQVRKAVDDVLWFQRLSDVAEVDKWTLTGPPNPRGKERYGIANDRHPFKVHTYTFVPRSRKQGQKLPAIVLPHGGVHGDFGTYHVHMVREMIARGYVVIAPEYRGSTGYGKDYQEAIDYGGLEVEDVLACRDWAVEHLPVDAHRIAITGWSHGGLIAILAACHHPTKFQAVYAGVPVSDLITRLGYHEPSYTALFAAKHHVGKPPVDAVDEYRKRSPVWQVHKLQTPLMVTSSTNDRDVNVVEVEQLLMALKAAGKPVQQKIMQDAPGGHSWDRIDTTLAKEARQAMFTFLAKHLGK